MRNFLNSHVLIAVRLQFDYPALLLVLDDLANERFGTIGCTEYDAMNIDCTYSNHKIGKEEQRGGKYSNNLENSTPRSSCLEMYYCLLISMMITGCICLFIRKLRYSQWNSCLEPIVLDCMNALTTRIDPVTHLYPFMQSAAEGAPLDGTIIFINKLL